ncbi:MAG: ABC transporter substrate-binding protein [Actinomycetota bacterium]
MAAPSPALPWPDRRLTARERQIIEDMERREFIIGGAAAAALVLAGCADDSDGARGSDETEPTEGTGQQVDTEPSPTVVDLADNVFDLAVLGIAPVANIYGGQFLEPVMSHLDLDPAVRDGILGSGLATVEASFELNVEAIAALEPDLILITEQFATSFDESALASVREIAEFTVIPDRGTWQDRSRAIAVAVGLEGMGEERISAAEEAIEALGALVAARGLEGREVSTLRFALDQFLSFIPPSLATEIITGAGLTIPQAAAALEKAPPFPDYHAQSFVSLELLGDFDADLLVLAEAVPDDGDTVISQPTLSGGRAVSANAIQRVPYFLWALNSAVGVSQICEDLTAGLDRLT